MSDNCFIRDSLILTHSSFIKYVGGTEVEMLLVLRLYLLMLTVVLSI